jgi:NitT/TauT family transport system permease protein
MRDKFTTIIFPAVTFVILVALWIFYLRAFKVPDYILPTPWSVVQALIHAFASGFIWPHLFYTLKSTLWGYLIGCGVGFLLGAALAESKIFEKFIHPYIVLLQSMPKVALAPLLIVWFGFGIESKIAMVVLMCFFPVFVNALVGFKQTDPDLIDVMRVSSASRLRIFFHVKLPTAAGTLFAGLEISIVLSLIGAVVGEFVAAERGMGTLLQKAATDLNMALMLATVFILAFLGLAGSLLIRFLHRKIIFWEHERQSVPLETT